MYNKVIEFKSTKERQGKYIEKTVTTPTGKEIVEHFIFSFTKFKLKKKFSRKFKRMFPNLKQIPKDIRMSLLSNEIKEFGIHRIAPLGQHTTITATKKHYIRTGVNL